MAANILGMSVLIYYHFHSNLEQVITHAAAAARTPYYIGHFGISSFNQTMNDTQMTVSQNLENSIDIVSGIKHL